eukprot:m.212556 g.212556  ORF g.212556 m.212556 type:complete len:324 (+) comp17165_c0_seq1:2694-3665(+)
MAELELFDATLLTDLINKTRSDLNVFLSQDKANLLINWPAETAETEPSLLPTFLKAVIDVTYQLQQRAVAAEFDSELHLTRVDDLLELFNNVAKQLSTMTGQNKTLLSFLSNTLGRELTDVWLWRSAELNYMLAVTTKTPTAALRAVALFTLMTRSPMSNYVAKEGSQDAEKMISAGIWSSTHLLGLMYACQSAQVYLKSDVPHAEACTVIDVATAPYLAMSSTVCHKCGVSNEARQLLKCSRCHKAWYCGRDCQKTGWKQHKVDCSLLTTIASLQDSKASFQATCLNMINLYLNVVTDAPAFVDWEQNTALELQTKWSADEE